MELILKFQSHRPSQQKNEPLPYHPKEVLFAFKRDIWLLLSYLGESISVKSKETIFYYSAQFRGPGSVVTDA